MCFYVYLCASYPPACSSCSCGSIGTGRIRGQCPTKFSQRSSHATPAAIFSIPSSNGCTTASITPTHVREFDQDWFDPRFYKHTIEEVLGCMADERSPILAHFCEVHIKCCRAQNGPVGICLAFGRSVFAHWGPQELRLLGRGII